MSQLPLSKVVASDNLTSRWLAPKGHYVDD